MILKLDLEPRSLVDLQVSKGAPIPHMRGTGTTEME